jgi:hypothetical protein
MTEGITYQPHSITPGEVYWLPDRCSSGANCFLERGVTIVPIGVDPAGRTSQGLRGYIGITIIRFASKKQNGIADADLTMTGLSTWARYSKNFVRAESLAVELNRLVYIPDY